MRLWACCCWTLNKRDEFTCILVGLKAFSVHFLQVSLCFMPWECYHTQIHNRKFRTQSAHQTYFSFEHPYIELVNTYPESYLQVKSNLCTENWNWPSQISSEWQTTLSNIQATALPKKEEPKGHDEWGTQYCEHSVGTCIGLITFDKEYISIRNQTQSCSHLHLEDKV